LCKYLINKAEFNFSTKKFKFKNGMISRSNHIAECINDYMLIFGGIDDNECYLNDFWVLDLNFMKWTKMETKGQRPDPIAFMCSALIISNDKRNNPNFNLFKPETVIRSLTKVSK
jgi:hypothetical protein